MDFAAMTPEELEQFLSRPEHLDQTVDLEKPITLMQKQAQFIVSESPFSAYGGGVGNGKSLSGIIKAYNHCINQPGAFFLIGRKHATTLRDSTQKDFLQLMRGYGKWMERSRTFQFPNGSEVIFRHLDDLNSLTNINLSGFWIDQAEEVSEVAFDYLVGRCRRKKGLTDKPITEWPKMITFNPNGHDWIWRLFHEKLDGDGKPLSVAKNYFLVVASTYENRENLPEEYIRDIENRPKEWKDRFLYGSFDTKSGRIYEEFSRENNVVPWDKQFPIPQWWPRFRMIDHGQTNATACLWGAADEYGNIWIYQEYYKREGTVTQHTRNIIDRSLVDSPSGRVPDDYLYTVIDPSTHIKNREKDGYRFSVADEYLEAGIPTINGQNSVEAGIIRVKHFLTPVEGRRHPWKTNHLGEAVMSSPRLFIFERCANTIREFPEYSWQPLKYNQIGQVNNPESKPVKFDDHCLDALRYGVMSRPLPGSELQAIDPLIWGSEMEMARYAKRVGRTVDDLIAERFPSLNDGQLRHSTAGISVKNFDSD